MSFIRLNLLSASWSTATRRSLLLSIRPVACRLAGTPQRLSATVLIGGAVIACFLAPSAGWAPAVALAATFLLVFGVLRMAEANDYPGAVAGLIVVAALSAMSAVWAFNGHAMVTREVGESYSIYLNAHNIADFLTLFVTDHSPGGDPAAHPFFYIHHPNLVPRVLSKLQQLAGLGIEHQVFVNILLGGVTLTVAYVALASTISRAFGLLAIGFLATNYAIFYESMSDLARGVHYALFFLLLYVITLTPRLERRGLNGAIAALLVLLILSDFAAFTFSTAFAIGWIVYLNRRILWGRMFLVMVLPSAAALSFYLAMVIAAIGCDFFLFDLVYTYLGRTGQFLSAHEKLLGAITPEATREAYRNHNVVLWARPVQEWGIGDIWQSWWTVLRFSVGVLAWLLAAAVPAVIILFFIFQRRGFIGLLIVAAVLIVSGFKLAMPLILLAPLFVFCWMVSAPRDSHRLLTSTARAGLRQAAVRPLLNAGALTVVLVTAFLATAAVFPEYTINFLLLGKRPPVPLVEMSAFAWWGVLIMLLWSRIGAQEFKFMSPPVGAVLAALPLVLVIAHNIEMYRRFPPSAPPYAKILAEPRFRGATFLTTGYYGLTWYYTRGWSNMSESGNPPRSLGYNVNLLHMADWRNRAKYGKPQYFLCDVSQYGGGPPSFATPKPCIIPDRCDCRDVANRFAEKGHTIVHSEPLFSILAINHNAEQ